MAGDAAAQQPESGIPDELRPILEPLLHRLPSNVSVLDAQGVVALANDAWRRRAPAPEGGGRAPGEPLVATLERAGGPLAELAKAMRDVLAGRLEKHHCVVPCPMPSGAERWERVTVSAISHHGRRFALVHCDEVTERVATDQALEQSQEELRRYREHLEDLVRERTEDLESANARLTQEMTERQQLERQMLHAQKLESLGVLAGGIAHDFNNLLVSMLGNASLALEQLEPDSAAVYSVAQIERAAVRAAELTNQLLAYAGKGTLRRESVDCAALVTEMGQLLETAVGRRGTLVYGCSAVPAIEADPGQLRQVVMNLITNAADALNSRGGTITVRTGTTQVDRGFLNAAVGGKPLPPAEYVFIDVADTGAGMDESTRVRIFDPFFTTKVSGHGLGLAAVLGIVRNHGGAVHVQSAAGAGTSIRVLLPLATAPLANGGVPATAAGGWRGDGTVLVVDDEAEVRQVAEAMLRRRGFDVVTAADGQEGVAALREHLDWVVAVLLDLEMPNLGGEAAFLALREVAPGVPIVISTGYSDHASLARIQGDPNTGMLPKPYSASQMAAALRAALDPAP